MSGTKEPSGDRRIPLSEVAFVTATALPGVTSTMFTQVTAGVRRVIDGKDWLPPAMWLDRELGVIKIGNRAFPLSRVHYYDQAPAAITKTPPPLDLDKFNHSVRK